MKPVCRSVVACAAAFFCAVAGAAPVEIDSIVAVVNDEVVTRAELIAETDRVERGLRERGARLPARAALEDRVLRSLIDRVLQLQFAEQNGVRVGDAQVDAALADIRADLDPGGDERSFALRVSETFGAAVPELRARVREDLRMQAAFYRGVFSRIEIDDADIERVAAALAAGERRYLLSRIVVSGAESGAARARETATTLARVATDENFADLAASHSDGENALSGGDLGWRDSSTLPDSFLDAIRGLGAGEVSEAVEIDDSFHILLVREIEDARASPAVDSARLRHILVADESGRERLLALKKSLADEDDFVAAARRHSIDSQSADQGGRFGLARARRFAAHARGVGGAHGGGRDCGAGANRFRLAFAFFDGARKAQPWRRESQKPRPRRIALAARVVVARKLAAPLARERVRQNAGCRRLIPPPNR